MTLLDRAIQSAPDLPRPPAAYDETLLPRINDTWEILPKAAPPRPEEWARVFEKQMAFNAAVVEHLNRNVAAHREAHAALERALPALRDGFDALERFESLLVQFLQTITPLSDTHYREIDDAIAQLRSVTDVAQRTAMLAKREVERRAAVRTGATAVAPVHPLHPLHPIAHRCISNTSASKIASADPRATIRARLADYVPYFAGQSNVLDVGCGRGEFLDLLRERGITATGLDLNAGNGRGLPRPRTRCDDRRCDAVICRALPDESLGGLIAVQVIEHLEPAYLTQMLGLAFDKVRPGGRIVLETINPACWVAFFESFIRDLTHVKPIHPETLQYLLQASGFSNVEIVYRAPIAPEGTLAEGGGAARTFRRHGSGCAHGARVVVQQQRRSSQRSNVLVPGLRGDRDSSLAPSAPRHLST